MTMKIDIVERSFKHLMERGLGLDMTDPDLLETPGRIARMYCQEFFKTIGEEFTDFKTSPNTHGFNNIIIFDNIDFVSCCSHHFLPFTGTVWVLYIPSDTLIGASKPARMVDHYSARPQLQENLSHEIINAFVKGIKPLGAMVVMRAGHGCMQCRGVRKSRAGMGTSAVRGAFEDPGLEERGLELIKLSIMS